MLARINRLTKDKDFERVAKQGEAVYSKEMAIKFLPNFLNFSRFGIVVSTKVHKSAVKRNLIKRRLRAIIKKNIKKIKTGYDVMILTKLAVLNLSYQEIKQILESLFEKAKLYYD